MQPVLFLSHGTESNFSKNTSFNYFTKKLSEKLLLRKPDIIICLTSLWNSEDLIIGTNLKKEIIYHKKSTYLNDSDHAIHSDLYPAPNAIIFSKNLEYYLQSNNISVKLENREFDFGTWGILSTLFPEADIPVIQMSIPEKEDLHYYYHLGKLLKKFSTKNILILVSGGLVYHNDYITNLINKNEEKIDIEPFCSWFNHCLIDNNINDLFDYQRKAPSIDSLVNMNDLVHLNSLFIALGATHGIGLKRLHSSLDNNLSYECFISKSLTG